MSILKHTAFSCFCVLIVCFFRASCSKEQAVPISLDFSISIVDDDYSVPVKVKVLSQTFGADAYSWTFSGADHETSTSKNPGTLVYSKLGTYTIRLEGSNKDGEIAQKEITFTLDAVVVVDFDTEIETNNFAPASVFMYNKTQGATSYSWTFEGGTPTTSTQKQPGVVLFTTPGAHRINLVVGNGRETHELEKIITVAEGLDVAFDWDVAFQDDDLQVPVSLVMRNSSKGVLTYHWSFTNATTSKSTEENPSVTFTKEGTQTITLTVSNGKETKAISKTIALVANTNLRTFTNVKFGINTAHHNNTIGAFFSATTREVYTKESRNTVEGNAIDLVFFGLGEDFSFNKFVAPDDLSSTTFPVLENAQHTRIINSQEQCMCASTLSVSEFDAITTDVLLHNLHLTETNGGALHFTAAIVPRVMLFQTADGRKGAIKIKEYVKDGLNSYILTDIKIQKK
jgi:PKD repeat protein